MDRVNSEIPKEFVDIVTNPGSAASNSKQIINSISKEGAKVTNVMFTPDNPILGLKVGIRAEEVVPNEIVTVEITYDGSTIPVVSVMYICNCITIQSLADNYIQYKTWFTYRNHCHKLI